MLVGPQEDGPQICRGHWLMPSPWQGLYWRIVRLLLAEGLKDTFGKWNAASLILMLGKLCLKSSFDGSSVRSILVGFDKNGWFRSHRTWITRGWWNGTRNKQFPIHSANLSMWIGFWSHSVHRQVSNFANHHIHFYFQFIFKFVLAIWIRTKTWSPSSRIDEVARWSKPYSSHHTWPYSLKQAEILCQVWIAGLWRM